MRRGLWISAALGALAFGCSGTVSDSDGGVGGGTGSAGGGTSSSGGGTGTGGGHATGGGSSTGGGSATGGGIATGGGSGTGGGSSACPSGDLLASLGKSTVMIGGSFEDSVNNQASFDIRYEYISGGLFDGTTPCASCASNCNAQGKSCANSAGGCAWWGCYQDDHQTPGEYVRDFVSAAKQKGELPMFTYYEVLQGAQVGEGGAEITALNDQAFLTRYFNDWRYLLQQIGTEKALLHIEPDLWGYGQQKSNDPHSLAAKVQAANPTDCGAMENSLAGFGKCMVAMAHQYAPNAKVGLHASAWGTGTDVSLNTSASFDVVGEANKAADFLVACGAADADFLVVETSDRDAGYYQKVQGQNRWWDATNATLPNFTQHFTWTKALSERIGRPLIWWQMPVGNMTLANTNDHYQDNRLDYFFDHIDQVAASHGVGVAFGAGADGCTTPSTDMGHFVSRTQAYKTAGGQTPCP